MEIYHFIVMLNRKLFFSVLKWYLKKKKESEVEGGSEQWKRLESFAIVSSSLGAFSSHSLTVC